MRALVVSVLPYRVTCKVLEDRVLVCLARTTPSDSGLYRLVILATLKIASVPSLLVRRGCTMLVASRYDIDYTQKRATNACTMKAN